MTKEKIFIESNDLFSGLACNYLNQTKKESCFVSFSSDPSKSLKDQHEDNLFNPRIVCCSRPLASQNKTTGISKQCNVHENSDKFKTIVVFDDRFHIDV